MYIDSKNLKAYILFPAFKLRASICLPCSLPMRLVLCLRFAHPPMDWSNGFNNFNC
uniref:Uncharacterized protein n=1 Tax=Picea sitchensis TaxID=3332 RepID=A0A6B9XT68_PICSI|nr:hypothetical protein Q903MT_gene6725 [Picea sitchensis]